MCGLRHVQIEVYDNEDGSFSSQCPVCGAVSMAWDDYDGAAHDIMSHIRDEHLIEEEY